MANTVQSLDQRGVLTPCPACGKTNRLAYGALDRTVRCGHCQQPLSPPASPTEVPDAATFAASVSSSVLPIVVDFWAPWCGPCRAMAPEVEKVARSKAGEWLVLKVNTEALPTLGEQYRIRSIPTMAVFHGGREVAREAGARPADQIKAFVARTLAAEAPAR